MSNKLLNILVLVVLSFAANAQNIEAFYLNMPDNLNPTLSKTNRLEVLEYYKAGQIDSTNNRFGNKVQVLTLDTINKLLVVKNSASSTFEMKLLQLADSAWAIGIIRTVCAPICISSLEFYDTSWKKIKVPVVIPNAIDWLNKKVEIPENIDVEWINNVLEDSFVSFSFDAYTQDIVVQNNSLEFQSEENRKILLPFLLDAKFRIRL
jgi:hypothetical protein